MRSVSTKEYLAMHFGPPPFPGLSEVARQNLLAIGPVWNDDIVGNRRIVIDAFTPVVAPAAAGIEVVRDCPYGPDPRHTIDVFRGPGEGVRPCVVFVHGGAFTRGAKSVNGVIYDNVLHWFAHRGFVGFNVEYRLALAARYPAGAEDLRDAIAWVESNAHRFGGDPDRIVLVGHSAGGAHVGTYMLDPIMRGTPSACVRGIVLLSARLRADVRPENPNAKNVLAYFGEDQDLFMVRSPVSHARNCRTPVFVGIAQYENRLLDQYGLEFALEVGRSTGRMPRVVQCPHHNHTSIVAHFGSPDETLGLEILRFVSNECFPIDVTA